MDKPLIERRHRRSSDPITALHYQLAFARHEGGLEALVLVDTVGALVAGAGAWPLCEQLAAFTPLLANQETIAHPETQTAVDAMRPDVRVHSLWVDGSEVLLAVKGPRSTVAQRSITQAASGCQRILQTTA